MEKKGMIRVIDAANYLRDECRMPITELIMLQGLMQRAANKQSGEISLHTLRKILEIHANSQISSEAILAAKKVE